MNFRQVHLDFHTSEKIPGIGSNFSKEQFQAALKTGHVNSITVFSKCHHGWAYHPSTANEMHPGLSFDLLEAEIEAAHEIGVKTPVYLSAGFDEKTARRHPEWCRRPEKNDTLDWVTPQFHELCMNTPYLDYLLAQIEEVVQKYDCDGIFLDIVGVRTCYCQHCVKTLLDEGKDPYDEKNAAELGERVYLNYTRKVRETIDKYKPGLPVFHNGGHIRKNKRELAHCDTHLELESLPTGGWGYDHFPLSAAYARTIGMDFLGMTGKFHTTWGEFGGFKHPNALRYEEALCTANGAKCSVGDQMHPDGHMDETTYALIGKAYAEVEEREPWLDNVDSVADIAIFSQEAVMNYFEDDAARTCTYFRGDVGAARMLLEGHFLFDVVDTQAPLDKYKLVILPDSCELDDTLTEKLKAFVKKGGKVLASGKSGLKRGEGEFALDLGCTYKGESKYNPVYFKYPGNHTGNGFTSYVIYSKSYDIEAKPKAAVTMERENPYFNRETFNFCSHQHAPNDRKAQYPSVTVGEDGAYIATEIFENYEQIGSFISKEIVISTINLLIGDEKTVVTNLPAQGVVTLMDQKKEHRLVNHLLYASPVCRGWQIQIIEDIIPIHDTFVELRTDKKPKRVYLAPEMKDLDFTYEDGVVTYTIDKFENHAMVVIDY